MKKRILAFALTLAMVVTSLSMLSFVSFAEVDDDANEEISTVLMAGYTAKEPVKVTSSATATATYSLVSGDITINVAATDLASVKANVGGYAATATATAGTATYSLVSGDITINVAATDLASVKANVGGYAATATATAGTATIAVPFNKVVIYKDATNNAVADLQLTVTTASDETFNGTLVFDLTQNVTYATGLFGGDKTWTQTAGTFAKPGGFFNYMMTDAGVPLGTNTERTIKFTFTANTMTAINVNSITWGSHWSANMELSQRVVFSFYSNKSTPTGSIQFQVLNTTNGGSEGQASLVVVYKNMDNTLTIEPLDVTTGTPVEFEVVFGYPTYGYIKANGKTLVEKSDIRSTPQGNVITSSNDGGFYAMGFVGSTSTAEAFDVRLTGKTIGTKTPKITADGLIALGADSNAITSEGHIKLSYVQETNCQTRTFSALTHGTASGNGGALSNSNSTLTVNNTAARAYAQGGFSPLGIYGNRTINFTLNVQNLNAYDFATKGGTLEGDAILSGDAKYADLSVVYGKNAGISGDCNKVQAFDKLLIGAVANASADAKTYAAMAFYVVNDTNDGLVLIHTNHEGEETVMIIGKDKMAQDINIAIVWNDNNTGSVKIDDAEAIIFDDCRTVISDFSKGTADTVTQCYFAGTGPSIDGYFGLNSTWSTENATEGYVSPNASIKSFTATTTMPLDVRFVATLDTLDAKEAGFEINLKGSDKVVKAPTTEAYKAITANTENGLEKIYAPDGKYFIAVAINNVPAEGTVTFVVKPYFAYAGETTYGTAYEVTYVNGVYFGAVAVAN